MIRHLQMERERFQIAYVGGVFRSAGDLMLDTLRAEVKKVAPRAYFEPPHFAPPSLPLEWLANASTTSLSQSDP